MSHADAETTARQALDDTRDELTATREQRDQLNDRIRLLDAQYRTLATVVGAFDRRRAVEAEAATPVRRRRRTGRNESSDAGRQ